MGWKRVKDHYRIGHIVHIVDGQLCIGSAYISQIIVVGPDGRIVKRDDGYRNADLARYQKEIEGSAERFVQLMAEPDAFSAALPVFTYDGATIIEKQCEAYGWPNVTHEGQLMYDNTFSEDKGRVVGWAKKDAEHGIISWENNLREARERVEKCQRELEQDTRNLASLNKQFPA